MSENSSPPLSTGDIIKRLVDVRDERRRIAARDKELVGEWRSLELELMIRLDEQQMEKASTKAGTASITTEILPQVVDWDEFYKYMQENDSLHLLQRRPATAAFRELHQSGIKVPGVESYEKKSISLRKA